MNDLQRLTLEELKTLRINVEQEIQDFENRRRIEALDAIKEIASQHGYKIEDLIGFGADGKSKNKLAAKYAHPENCELTWAGRGRKPLWVVAQLELGRSMDELLIKQDADPFVEKCRGALKIKGTLLIIKREVSFAKNKKIIFD